MEHLRSTAKACLLVRLASRHAQRQGAAPSTGRLFVRAALLAVLLFPALVPAVAQTSRPATPPANTSVPPAPVSADADRGTSGEIPIDTPNAGPPGDASATASPVPGGRTGVSLASGTALHITLSAPADSAHNRNESTIAGALTAPVRASDGRTIPAGAPVRLTVVSSAPAGTMTSAGVLTLEVYQVGGIPVISDVVSFNGQDGKRDLPDSAPAKGTEARVDAGTVLNFNVMGRGDQFDPGQGGGGGRNPGAGSGGRGGNTGQGAQGTAQPAPSNTLGRPIPGATQSGPQTTTPH